MKKTSQKSAKTATYNPKIASLILRVGLAGVFAYAAIDALREPAAWVLFIPSYAHPFVSAETALTGISITQLVLAAWLLSGKYAKYAGGLAAVMLAAIMLMNRETILITFRDFGLIAAALAVILLDE